MKTFLFKKYFGVTPLFMALFFIFSFILYIHPEWDLEISALFYDHGHGFYLKNKLWAYVVYRGVHVLAFIMCSVYALFILASFIKHNPNLFGISRKAVMYLLIVFVVGPGLIVNQGLKENIGRARPAVVEHFGGEKKFTSPFIFSDQCDSNCSFVSGHASFGYYWVALSFLTANPRRKKIILSLSVFSGLFIGMVRVIQGRHFFSDIVLAFFFVYIAAAVIYYFMYERVGMKR